MILKPALADSIESTKLAKYMQDPTYAFEPKMDGHRVLILTAGGKAKAFNRGGKEYTRGLPVEVTVALRDLPTGSFVLDGELVGDTFWLFDVLVVLGSDVTHCKFADRRAMLIKIHERTWPGGKVIRLTPSVVDPLSKLALVRTLVEQGGEGVMVKDLDGVYCPGKRTPAMLKAKFVKTADCVVIATKLDGKDNMSLGLYDVNGRLVEVAHCTALAGDGATIKAGDVVEVNYLYAVDPKKPRLYQPTYPKIRTDKSPIECTLQQLHYSSRTLSL